MWAASLPYPPSLLPINTLWQLKPRLLAPSLNPTKPLPFGFHTSLRNVQVFAEKKSPPSSTESETENPIPFPPPSCPPLDNANVSSKEYREGIDLGWLPAFPHVILASMSNFIFGYHIGVMNGPIVSIARELGFEGNTLLEGLVVSPTRYRGSLGALCQIATCLGIIAALILGVPSESDPHWWRIMLYIATVPGFILIFGMQFAVESPRWLCKVGRINDAKTVICNLWGESEVNSSIEEIQSVIRNDGSDRGLGWFELFVKPHNRVAFIGGALFVLQQFSGINGVLYFSSLTFHDVGIASSALASLFVGISNGAGSLFALYLMDKQGRKRLLIGSYFGMAISMFMVVFATTFPADEDLTYALSVLGTLMYIFAFAIGAGPVTGIVIPELSSARTRGKIMGFSFSVHWVCNFIVGLFFLELVDRFGIGPVYASFGGTSLLSAIFAMYFIVETKGRSLEEIEMSLNPDFLTKGE
ncbi:major facilitator superfamily protein isoform X2 [Tasmannia lanceolata]|uniref:major facilitator superfamily protein isoform X2 n=1 Tax=Tasmannia lanceolata TaxID=3420 RepID=UPI004062A249